MRALFVYLSALILLAGCDQAGMLSKKGDKIDNYTMLEDAKLFASLQECKAALAEANEKYGVTITADEALSTMHINVGKDSTGSEYMNSCSEKMWSKNYVLRITKK